jgi:probable HAF family extracellular repeat protein
LGEGQCLAINARGQILGLEASGGTFVIALDRSRINLGPMPDGSSAVGTALGPAGEVVGFSESETGRRAIRYVSGQWQALDGVGGTWSVAAGIDEEGVIAGTFGSSDGSAHAFLWQAGKLKPLPVDSAPNSSAFARVKGSTIGVFQTADKATHAFVLSAEGILTDLGTLGGTSSNAFALNDKGTVVGSSRDAANVVGAFLWKSGASPRALGVPSGARASEARGVDATGRVFGNVVDSTGIAHGVYFDTEHAAILELPLPTASPTAIPAGVRVLAVAADGRAIGTGVMKAHDGDPIHCVLWSPL